MLLELSITYILFVSADIDVEVGWSDKNTLMLLDLYSQRLSKFEDKTIKRKHLWREVSKVFADKGLRFTTEQCEGKWKGLMRSYKKYLASKNTTGNNAKQFAYSTEMDDLLGHRHDIFPRHLAGNNVPEAVHEPTDDLHVDATQAPLPKKKKKESQKEANEILEFLREYTKQKDEREAEKMALYENVQNKKLSLLERLIGSLEKE